MEKTSGVTYTCAYWSQRGTWSPDGCFQESSNITHTVCKCFHLSSFAVLMALTPMEVRKVSIWWGTLKCSQHWCYRRETQVWGVSVMVRKCDDRSLSCLDEGEGTSFGPQKDFTRWPELVLSETKNRTVVRGGLKHSWCLLKILVI